MLSVADVMTPKHRLVVTGPEATVWEARRAMESNGIRHLPVVAAGELAGLVSQTDILVAASGQAVRVREIMVRDLDTIDPRANVLHAALRMQRTRRSCLPVVRDGKLLGIVTDSDFVGIAITLMEQMEEVEPEPEPDEEPASAPRPATA